MKYLHSRQGKTSEAGRAPSPAPVIIQSSAALLCIIYISAIIILLLPESLCDPQRAMQCAQDIFSASFRVVVLAAISAVSAEIIDARFPDSQ